MNFQHTISEKVSCTGIGLHSGKEVRLAILPAPPDTGIEFRRTDAADAAPIKAHTRNVVSTNFATTIGDGNYYIATIEHLMSAFSGLGVDNAIVEVDAEEVPIMDGSAAGLVYLISMVGLKRQETVRRCIVIQRPISVAEGDKRAAIYPCDCQRLTYTIDYDHPMIKLQQYEYTHEPRLYESEIARARTFGFLSEVNTMQSNGFASGGNLDNAVLVGSRSVLNEGGLRFQDEFVRHKILDAMGDLYMAGRQIVGHYIANKSGHGLNHELMKKLLASVDSWKMAEAPAHNPGQNGANKAIALAK